MTIKVVSLQWDHFTLYMNLPLHVWNVRYDLNSLKNNICVFCTYRACCSHSSDVKICGLAHYLTETAGVFIKVLINLHNYEQELLQRDFIYSRHIIFPGLIRAFESSSEFHTFAQPCWYKQHTHTHTNCNNVCENPQQCVSLSQIIKPSPPNLTFITISF